MLVNTSIQPCRIYDMGLPWVYRIENLKLPSAPVHQVDESRARPAGAISRPSIGKAMARIGSNDSTLRYIEATALGV